VLLDLGLARIVDFPNAKVKRTGPPEGDAHAGVIYIIRLASRRPALPFGDGRISTYRIALTGMRGIVFLKPTMLHLLNCSVVCLLDWCRIVLFLFVCDGESQRLI
jgi:hypothetical protein